MALGTAIAGLVTVGNLWIIMMLTYRLTRGLSVQGEGLGMVGLVAVVKFPLAIGAYTLVAYAFDVLAAFLGLLVLVVPVVVRGAVYLARTPIPSDSNELEVEGM